MTEPLHVRRSSESSSTTLPTSLPTCETTGSPLSPKTMETLLNNNKTKKRPASASTTNSFRVIPENFRNDDDADIPLVFFDNNPFRLSMLIFLLANSMGFLISLVTRTPRHVDLLSIFAYLFATLPVLSASTLRRVKVSCVCIAVFATKLLLLYVTLRPVRLSRRALVRYFGTRLVYNLGCILPHALGTTSSAEGEIESLVGGLALYGFGFLLETVADYQKVRHDALHPYEFCHDGLWAYARQPDYTGQIIMWIGIFVMHASSLYEKIIEAKSVQQREKTVKERLVRTVEKSWRIAVAALGPLVVVYVLYGQSTGRFGLSLKAAHHQFGYGLDPVYTAYIKTVPVFGSFRRFDPEPHLMAHVKIAEESSKKKKAAPKPEKQKRKKKEDKKKKPLAVDEFEDYELKLPEDLRRAIDASQTKPFLKWFNLEMTSPSEESVKKKVASSADQVFEVQKELEDERRPVQKMNERASDVTQQHRPETKRGGGVGIDDSLETSPDVSRRKADVEVSESEGGDDDSEESNPSTDDENGSPLLSKLGIDFEFMSRQDQIKLLREVQTKLEELECQEECTLSRQRDARAEDFDRQSSRFMAVEGFEHHSRSIDGDAVREKAKRSQVAVDGETYFDQASNWRSLPAEKQSRFDADEVLIERIYKQVEKAKAGGRKQVWFGGRNVRAQDALDNDDTTSILDKLVRQSDMLAPGYEGSDEGWADGALEVSRSRIYVIRKGETLHHVDGDSDEASEEILLVDEDGDVVESGGGRGANELVAALHVDGVNESSDAEDLAEFQETYDSLSSPYPEGLTNEKERADDETQQPNEPDRMVDEVDVDEIYETFSGEEFSPVEPGVGTNSGSVSSESTDHAIIDERSPHNDTQVAANSTSSEEADGTYDVYRRNESGHAASELMNDTQQSNDASQWMEQESTGGSGEVFGHNDSSIDVTSVQSTSSQNASDETLHNDRSSDTSSASSDQTNQKEEETLEGANGSVVSSDEIDESEGLLPDVDASSNTTAPSPKEEVAAADVSSNETAQLVDDLNVSSEDKASLSSSSTVDPKNHLTTEGEEVDIGAANTTSSAPNKSPVIDLSLEKSRQKQARKVKFVSLDLGGAGLLKVLHQILVSRKNDGRPGLLHRFKLACAQVSARISQRWIAITTWLASIWDRVDQRLNGPLERLESTVNWDALSKALTSLWATLAQGYTNQLGSVASKEEK